SHQLRRRRPSARAVLCCPQHRDRLEGEHLHDGNLRGASAAEVRLQGNRSSSEGAGRGLADDALKVRLKLQPDLPPKNIFTPAHRIRTDKTPHAAPQNQYGRNNASAITLTSEGIGPFAVCAVRMNR